ncbi:hypothetical protein HUE87_02650 [Candidatus Sulfurimonas marisnigri]|uniref:Uncharacterized protein n=1 Tax=Candidatus Sulfurimonas marisnigri TaxID=2740405 RepID=A0A7S7M110_9BACT|nr:hypothetical protein [Candidatus Sulfurimonas marisnigri]QOY55157.1 hypothetical protein HUE87_02650 [Candidatus Sulfurimonas marisnigri]
MNSLIIALLPILLFTGCFRVIPESAVLPKIHMDKKYTKSKKMTFNDNVFSVNSPNGGLVVLNRDNGFTFINPNTNEKIKELDKTYEKLLNLTPLLTVKQNSLIVQRVQFI